MISHVKDKFVPGLFPALLDLVQVWVLAGMHVFLFLPLSFLFIFCAPTDRNGLVVRPVPLLGHVTKQLLILFCYKNDFACKG